MSIIELEDKDVVESPYTNIGHDMIKLKIADRHMNDQIYETSLETGSNKIVTG